MDRVQRAKTALQVQASDQLKGVHQEHAMLYSLEVTLDVRRRGLGNAPLHAVAKWAI